MADRKFRNLTHNEARDPRTIKDSNFVKASNAGLKRLAKEKHNEANRAAGIVYVARRGPN